ncbi:MAG: HEPN domain-containing protein [Candidatus Hydrogenedentota bacterium]|nr:MAG: HEPN domain-containing protein [Candidatus Hydrogenedentota bacterium]
MSRVRDWLAQAQNDFAWALDSFERKYYAQTCFIAQQVAEKALKAIGYYRGADLVKGHSCAAIAAALGINGELEDRMKELDQYYIPTRYPDALPAGSPFETYTKRQAEEALHSARLVLDLAENTIQL